MNSKGKILIVKNEVIAANNLEINLSSFGYSVTSIVDNGRHAIEKAHSDNPDIVLMDIRLKGNMDGIAAAEIIQTSLGIPVVLCTAYLDLDRIEQAKVTTPFSYVLKPVQKKVLGVTLDLALCASKANRKRKQAETEKSSRNKRLGLMLECSDEIVFLMDAEHNILEINKVASQRLGLPMEQIVGKSPGDFVSAEIGEHLNVYLRQAIDTGKVIIYEDQRRDCSFRHRMVPVKAEDGSLTWVALYTRDITRERQLKSERDTLFTQVAGMACILDTNGRINEINRAWMKKTGWKEDDLKDKLCLKFIHPGDKKLLKSAFVDILKKRRERLELEGRFYQSNGEPLWLSYCFLEIKNKHSVLVTAKPAELYCLETSSSNS